MDDCTLQFALEPLDEHHEKLRDARARERHFALTLFQQVKGDIEQEIKNRALNLIKTGGMPDETLWKKVLQGVETEVHTKVIYAARTWAPRCDDTIDDVLSLRKEPAVRAILSSVDALMRTNLTAPKSKQQRESLPSSASIVPRVVSPFQYTLRRTGGTDKHDSTMREAAQLIRSRRKTA